ncbi:cathelicidin-related peptide Oh-Cath-like [Spea bombifrons]|uniref:cathelicidin-related peptide Oh-Cath-like n=1 Tax=Spea bombifrons TaxID=233779 RepID=UPI0023495FFB|nr:cathelicidin-related peptide Oh-Cath-like [Spea bombifrons]
MAPRRAVRLFASLAFIVCTLAELQEINIHDDEFIKKAVEFFNEKENVNYAFKASSYLGGGYRQVEDDLQVVSFVIQETLCVRSENYNLGECDFNPDGEVKFCSTYLGVESYIRNIACNTVSEDHREKRSSKKKRCNFFCKLAQRFRAPGRGSNIAHGGSSRVYA